MNQTPLPRIDGITLYTRPGCPYCVAARTTLVEHGLSFEEVDISTSAELSERYNVCVPVVVVDGRVRFRGRVNGPLLRKLLKRPHPQPPS